ncbi:hypothetical protein Vretifemale_9282 [Volvox reticuliferus]|nr:hypothetical protein Vretifemale_9282 [Volvox reticuliferus]
MKMAAQQLGVTVPAWVDIKRFGPMGHEGVEKGLAEVLAPPEQGGLRFPLIVKHPSGYSSVGMTKQSKVYNAEELRQQVDLLVKQFGGALVEEFIEGREFTVLVVEEPKGGEGNASAAVTATSGGATAGVTAGTGTATADAVDTTDCGTGNGTASAPSGAVSGAAADAITSDPDSSRECTTLGTATATTKSESGSGTSFKGGEAPKDVEDDGEPFRVVAYMPVECAFAPGEDFKHFQLKWHDYDTCSWHPCSDPKLAEQLKDAALKTFIAMHGVSYGRCDFRVDTAGEVYLLEMNSNCGMLYPPGLHGSGDFILTLDPHRDHMHFIRTIITTALQRYQMRQPKVVREFVRRPRAAGDKATPPAADCAGTDTATIGHSRGSGSNGRSADGEWGMVAVAPISTGEVVRRGEQLPLTVASRGWMGRCYPAGGKGLKRTLLQMEAYPLSDEIWVTRSDDPSSWAPLHHSCDPNTWFRGLDVVARRDIQPGEVITIDFATFRAGSMEPFDCCCGAACCRGRVTGDDYLGPWLGERYGSSHVSAYVAERRRRAGLSV